MSELKYTKGAWLQNSSTMICDNKARVLVITFPYAELPDEIKPSMTECEANASLVVACCSKGRALRLAKEIIGIKAMIDDILPSGIKITTLAAEIVAEAEKKE